MEQGMLFESACYIKHATWENSGDYWCSSEDGRRSTRSTLTVVGVNSVTMRISTVPVARGDDIALTCTSDSSDLLSDTPVVFYKDNVVIAALTRGYMVIRNFTDARHKGYYKCEIPGYGESQYNLIAVEADGEICELYDPAYYWTATKKTTTTESHGIKTLDNWGIAIVCLTVIPIVILSLCLCWMTMRTWRVRRRWRMVQEEDAEDAL